MVQFPYARFAESMFVVNVLFSHVPDIQWYVSKTFHNKHGWFYTHTRIYIYVILYLSPESNYRYIIYVFCVQNSVCWSATNFSFSPALPKSWTYHVGWAGRVWAWHKQLPPPFAPMASLRSNIRRICEFPSWRAVSNEASVVCGRWEGHHQNSRWTVHPFDNGV